MNETIDVPEYSPETGLRLDWEFGFEICVSCDGAEVVLRANTAGLRSLARHLLLLAREEVPAGHHIHLDESSALDDGSCALMIEKV